MDIVKLNCIAKTELKTTLCLYDGGYGREATRDLTASKPDMVLMLKLLEHAVGN